MSTITFDSERLVEDLEASGIPIAQARAVVRGIVEAQNKLVTSEYLDARLHQELAPLRQDLAVLKWMMGFVMAGILTLLAGMLSVVIKVVFV